MATTTQPASSAPPQPAPAQQAQQQAAVATLTILLLSGLAAADLAALAGAALAPLGITPAAAAAALGMLGPHATVDAPLHPPGSAQAWTIATRPARRAAYVVNAARRLGSVPLADERRYLGQHLSAERARLDAAAKADSMASLVGTTLGWYSTLDDRTTGGCRAMHGRNFGVGRPPVVEGRPALPGAVHPACRCLPGPPHPVLVAG